MTFLVYRLFLYMYIRIRLRQHFEKNVIVELQKAFSHDASEETLGVNVNPDARVSSRQIREEPHKSPSEFDRPHHYFLFATFADGTRETEPKACHFRQ